MRSSFGGLYMGKNRLTSRQGPIVWKIDSWFLKFIKEILKIFKRRTRGYNSFR